MVGHEVTETGVRQNRIAFGNTLGLKVEMAVEFERSHGHHTINRRLKTLRREKPDDGVTHGGRRARRVASRSKIGENGGVNGGSLSGETIVFE